MSKENRRILFGIFFGVTLIVAVCFLIMRRKPAAPVEVNSGFKLVMGTFARMLVVAPDKRTAQRCIDAAFEQFRQIEALMSWRKEDSEIAHINRDAYANPVRVSEPTFEVLQKSVEFSRLSGGAFDITVGPLMELWRRAEDANHLPTDAELKQTLSRVGFEKLILDANNMTVRFAVDGMKLDLGGIAKGYAVDKAVEAMQKAGAVGAMVDAGGDIRCFGTPSKGKTYWLIGLQDPDVEIEKGESKIENLIGGGKPLLILKFTDAAVATSGNYRRFVTVGRKKYSHIVDPKSGYSSESLASVTIICPAAIDADALGTAVTVMGEEKGLALIEQMPGTEAILITSAPEFKRIQTSGVEKFIK
jgi:thiamine biosynthesis lipoprotein